MDYVKQLGTCFPVKTKKEKCPCSLLGHGCEPAKVVYRLAALKDTPREVGLGTQFFLNPLCSVNGHHQHGGR